MTPQRQTQYADMKRSLILLVGLSMVIACCDTMEEGSDTITSGQTVVSSEPVGQGFSFAEGKVTAVKPDFLVSAQLSATNEVEGVFLSGLETTVGFRFVSTLASGEEAERFFRDLDQVPESGYEGIALSVRQHQVWAVRDQTGNFAKIRMVSVSVSEDRVGSVEFAWMYQTDGSPRF